MPTKDMVELRLWLAAQHRAAEFGFTFAEDCQEGHFKPFLSEGVRKIEEEGYLNDPVRIAFAEANIVAFTTRMILAAQEMQFDQLHEPTFFDARVMCPLWPFC